MNDLILFMSLVIFGEFFNLLVLHGYNLVLKQPLREHHFKFSHYIYFLLFPLLASVIMVVIHGRPIVYAFLIFSAVGITIEWLIGFAYDQFIGQKLWTYHRFTISGYTSLLSIPIWAMAGVLFWLLARIII